METITFGKRVGRHAAEWAPVAHDRRRAAVARGLRRGGAPHAPRPHGGGAPVADPRRARRDDARELRGVPARGPDAEAGRDRARAARALRACRRGRQGRRLQLGSDPGARARIPARARRVHGRVRARAQGEPGRARATARLPRPRRRELPPPHPRDLGGWRTATRLEAGDDDEVAASGAHVLRWRWP